MADRRIPRPVGCAGEGALRRETLHWLLPRGGGGRGPWGEGEGGCEEVRRGICEGLPDRAVKMRVDDDGSLYDVG